MDERLRVVNIFLDEKTLGKHSPEIEHERAVAIFDLLEENYFSPTTGELGPFILHLSIKEKRLCVTVCDEADNIIMKFELPLSYFRSIIKDYFLICESYYSAIKISSPSKIQAIDMARRSLHNDGSEILLERLGKYAEVDFDTARQLFTLLCVLHSR